MFVYLRLCVCVSVCAGLLVPGLVVLSSRVCVCLWRKFPRNNWSPGQHRWTQLLHINVHTGQSDFLCLCVRAVLSGFCWLNSTYYHIFNGIKDMYMCDWETSHVVGHLSCFAFCLRILRQNCQAKRTSYDLSTFRRLLTCPNQLSAQLGKEHLVNTVLSSSSSLKATETTCRTYIQYINTCQRSI